MMDVQIVLPERVMDALAEGLCGLTETISKKDPEIVAHGFLGGSFGYGAKYENDVFAMHPFCWCEQEDCLWCGGCDCPEDSFHFFVDGVETDYRGWMDFYMRGVYGMTDAELEAKGTRYWDIRPNDYERKSEQFNRRRTQRHDPVCDYCTGSGIWSEHGAEPGRGAPNFWHKPSGLKVWWYKYIGRDMTSVGDCKNVSGMIAECIASLVSKTTLQPIDSKGD